MRCEQDALVPPVKVTLAEIVFEMIQFQIDDVFLVDEHTIGVHIGYMDLVMAKVLCRSQN